MPERSRRQIRDLKNRVLNVACTKHVSIVTAHPCHRILPVPTIPYRRSHRESVDCGTPVYAANAVALCGFRPLILRTIVSINVALYTVIPYVFPRPVASRAEMMRTTSSSSASKETFTATLLRSFVFFSW